jgi:hypothetical protein
LFVVAANAAVGRHERAVELLLELVNDPVSPLRLPPSLQYRGHTVTPAAAAVYWALAEQQDALGDVHACAAAAAAAAAHLPQSSTSGDVESNRRHKKLELFKDMPRQFLTLHGSCTSRAAAVRSHGPRASAVAAVTTAAAVLLSPSTPAASRARAIEHLHGALASASQHCVIDFTSIFHSSFIKSFVRSLIIHRSSLPLPIRILSLSLLRIVATPPQNAKPCSMGYLLDAADVPHSLLDIFVDKNEHATVRLEAALGVKICLDSCGKYMPWMDVLGSSVIYVIESTALKPHSAAALPSEVSDSLAAAAVDIIRHFVNLPPVNNMDAFVKVVAIRIAMVLTATFWFHLLQSSMF